MTTVEILRVARDYLADPRHWQGGRNHRDPVNHACASNAIAWVNPQTRAVGQEIASLASPYMDAQHALLRAIGAPASEVREIFRWNDSPATRHADVLAAFDRAIAAELAREQEFNVAPNRTIPLEVAA